MVYILALSRLVRIFSFSNSNSLAVSLKSTRRYLRISGNNLSGPKYPASANILKLEGSISLYFHDIDDQEGIDQAPNLHR